MKQKLFKYILIVVLIMLLNYVNVFAEPLKDLNSEVLAISLVIDTSGSMIYTDPQKIREDVANVFIDLLSPDDYLGIITFNSTVDLVIPMEQLKDDLIRQSFKERLKPKLQGVANTDYNLALKKANEELEGLYKNNIRKVIIFLTDGEPDPDDIGNDLNKMNIYINELWDTVGKISKNNIPIYSIGFSDEIDVEILNRLAKETNGDVRIFKDANSLDQGLIQVLKSREKIVDNLLAPLITETINIPPTLNTDFWLKKEGYRKGEETVISSFLTVAGTKVQSSADLVLDNFELIINYDDGEGLILPLYDNGSMENGDIRPNDGIWSNKLVFNKKGKARANLILIGKFKNQPLKLEKYIGEFMVSDLGNISLESYENEIWIKSGEILTIPIKVQNQSAFRERVLIKLDDNIGKLTKNQFELEPNWSGDISLDINLNSNLKKSIHELELEFETFNKSTTINGSKISYSIEVVSSIEHLKRVIIEKYFVLIPIIGFLTGVPFIIYLIGMILYLFITRPQMKVRGKLSYWKDNNPEIKKEIDLTKKKKNKIIISFDSNKEVDFIIEESKYKYDLIIENNLLKKRWKFILGWLMIKSKKKIALLEISATQPGIIQFNDDIFTKIDLFNNDEFASGGFNFQYINPKSKLNISEKEGRDVLEGRI